MNEIRMEIHLPVSPSRVWESITDRDQLSKWLMRSDIGTEVGTRFRFTSPPSGTWDGIIESEVRESIEGERISYTWNANDVGVETLVTYELRETAEGTCLTLSHTGFEGALPGAEGRHAAGWTEVLKALRTVLCGKDPDYDWSAFQIASFIEAPVSDLFRCWTTSAGLEEFWPDKARCRDPQGRVRPPEESFQTGDRIALTFPTGRSTELEIINMEKDRFLAFRFGEDYGWVRVTMSDESGRTRIVLRQFGLPTDGDATWEVHANARCWWIFNLMNLKASLLHQTDLRVRDDAVANGLGAVYRPGDKVAKSPHDWTRFDLYLYVNAPPEEVMSRWTTSAGLESFFIGKAHHSDASGEERTPKERTVAGDSYDWEGIHGYRMKGAIVESDARRITFTFGSRYFVEVSVTPHREGTLLHLEQSGMEDNPEDRVAGSLNCRSCWTYFLATLKSQAESGIDLRDRVPATADAISVGYQKRIETS